MAVNRLTHPFELNIPILEFQTNAKYANEQNKVS